jgi:hypothetical protein
MQKKTSTKREQKSFATPSLLDAAVIRGAQELDDVAGKKDLSAKQLKTKSVVFRLALPVRHTCRRIGTACE